MNTTIAPTETLGKSDRLPPAPVAPLPIPGGERQASPEARLQELVEQIQQLPDPTVRELAAECLQSVLELYGSGLARVLQLVQNAGDRGTTILDALLRDKLIRSLLLVHGLHPVALETRLHEALDKVRPYMQSHGGNVELLSLEEGVARLRFNGACKTCPSSTLTMELAIRSAIEEACPDLAGFELETENATLETSPPRKCHEP